MTYQELLDKLENLSEEQLDMDVTVYINDEDGGEYYPAVYFGEVEPEDNVLDKGHPIISIDV